MIGLPWWRSGWESACQCRGRGFDPWPGRIPHAAEQLGPCATTTEPVLLQQERPQQWGARALQRGVAPACLNWREAVRSGGDPTQPKI